MSADSENVVIKEEVVIQKEAKCEPIERMLPYDEELEGEVINLIFAHELCYTNTCREVIRLFLWRL